MIKTMQGIIDYAKTAAKRRIVVAVAQDEEILQAVYDAHRLGLVEASLVGDKTKILTVAEKLQMDISGYEIINESDNVKAIKTSVDKVKSGEADILMKGMIQTADLLKAVLDKEANLRQGNRSLSHLAILEMESYPKLLFVTDSGLNIAPTLQQKADITQNAVDVAIALGIVKPKVAVLSAVEIVNPAMQSSLDAAVLVKMADRGQIKNCIIDGPLAADNALSAIAARHKGVKSDVAGEPDILVMPNIESGNIMYKSLVFLSGVKSCGVVVGAKIPLVVVSRAESALSKLYSICLASVISIGKNSQGVTDEKKLLSSDH